MKKTRLKISSAFGMPAINGYVANTMGTLPLKPTQEIKSLLRTLDLKKDKDAKTLIGLATKIKKADINKPIPISGIIREGNTNNPNVRKSIICISHAWPS